VEIVHQPKLAFCSKGENQDSRRRHPSLGQMQRICMPIANPWRKRLSSGSQSIFASDQVTNIFYGRNRRDAMLTSMKF
jgi:hypothetical protein